MPLLNVTRLEGEERSDLLVEGRRAFILTATDTTE